MKKRRILLLAATLVLGACASKPKEAPEPCVDVVSEFTVCAPREPINILVALFKASI